VVQAPDIVEGEGSIGRLESADDEIQGRQNQEKQRESEKRQDSEPSPRELPSPHL
jgi:hypothetical protein